MLLLLTVGTGTAGRTSNLVAGLRRAIELSNPERFWLVPSTDEVSQLTADEVCAGQARFAPWSAEVPYCSIEQPDDLEACRAHLRAILHELSRQLRPGQRLVLNPTSGTKQMTAAAVLAALDEGLGDITFIAGERADGVVITGTERLTSFDPSGYFRERDFATARDLFAVGAFAPAARLLQPHADHLPRAQALCLTLHHWRRFAYTEAVAAANGHWEDLRRALATRAQHAAAGTPSLLLLGDVLAWAEHAQRLGEAGDCLTLAYKALELAARFALHDTCRLQPTRTGRFAIGDVRAVARSLETDGRLTKLARDGEVAIGLSLACTLLSENDHPLGHAFDADARLRQLTFVRNESVHDLRPPEMSEAQALLDRVRNLLTQTLPPSPPLPIPVELPNA